MFNQYHGRVTLLRTVVHAMATRHIKMTRTEEVLLDLFFSLPNCIGVGIHFNVKLKQQCTYFNNMSKVTV